MAKNTRVEDEDFPETDEDFEEEEEEPLPAKPVRRPVPNVQVERTNKFAEKPKPVQENRFVFVHSPNTYAVLDSKNGNEIKAQSQDPIDLILERLASIESQLQRIEESLG